MNTEFKQYLKDSIVCSMQTYHWWRAHAAKYHPPTSRMYARCMKVADDSLQFAKERLQLLKKANLVSGNP